MKKRVLIIIPNLGIGGAQQVFRQQMKYLASEFEVFGCVFNWDGAFPEDHSENIFSLNVPAGKSVIGKIRFFILRTLRVRDIKQKNKIDISISHLEGADYVNLLSRGESKTICWIHGTKKYDENINGPLGVIRMKVLMPILYKRASKIITVSKGIAFELSKSIKGLENRIFVIYNGFDLQHIVKLSNEPLENQFSSLFSEHNVIITHCRLSRQKNLTALLKIFGELKKIENARLIIVGDGELRDELISFAKSIHINVWSCWDNQPINEFHEVYFLGQRQNPFNLLKRARMYVMTSGWEGFPLALCEAMACGLPVVATDCYTGPREIIAPELNGPQPLLLPYHTHEGILMPLVDVSSNDIVALWVNELKDALNGKRPSLIGAGYERIKDFQLSNSISQTINVIKEL